MRNPHCPELFLNISISKISSSFLNQCREILLKIQPGDNLGQFSFESTVSDSDSDLA